MKPKREKEGKGGEQEKKRDTELQCFQMSNTINIFAYTT